jgi:hypothetical protein
MSTTYTLAAALVAGLASAAIAEEATPKSAPALERPDGIRAPRLAEGGSTPSIKEPAAEERPVGGASEDKK